MLSWSGWLKLVDRVGAPRAALLYFALYAIAIAAALLATFGAPSERTADRSGNTPIRPAGTWTDS